MLLLLLLMMLELEVEVERGFYTPSTAIYTVPEAIFNLLNVDRSPATHSLIHRMDNHELLCPLGIHTRLR